MFFDNEGPLAVQLLPTSQQRLNSQNEHRIRLNLRMPLEDELEGFPEEVLAAYKSVAAISQGITRATISTEYEHIDIEFRPLPDKDIIQEVKDITIRSLAVWRKTPKDGAAEEVFLSMSTTVPYSKKLWSYVGDNGGATVFAEFFEAQGILTAEDAPAAPKEKSAKAAPKKKSKKR